MECVSSLPAGGKDAGGREESLKEERPVISRKGFVKCLSAGGWRNLGVLYTDLPKHM